jgi:hypothetical protein
MQTVEEWVNERLNKLHMIKIAKLMPEAAANEIFKSMPSGDIFESNEFIDFIRKNIGIQEEDLINQAIDILIQQKKLIAVERSGKVFYRKLELISSK